MAANLIQVVFRTAVYRATDGGLSRVCFVTECPRLAPEPRILAP